MNSTPFSFREGSIPLLVSIPHNGFRIPVEISATMTADGKSSRDTDWFLDQLYDFPELADASLLVAEFSRYVIDLNRAESNESLYPGQTTTGLIPDTCFDGAKIYASGLPNESEVARRIETFWRPYHQQIESEMLRLSQQHGLAVLVEAHSIASRVPRLFQGQLPDFNLGTNNEATCDRGLQSAIVAILESQSAYSHVVNGRFVGGYITRHFGQPQRNWHAVQFELSQNTYMNEADLSWNPTKAAVVQPLFQSVFAAIKNWIQTQ